MHVLEESHNKPCNRVIKRKKLFQPNWGGVMDKIYRDKIKKEFSTCVIRTIDRLRDSDGEGSYRPLHSALLTKEVIFLSRLERSFSTSFGQRAIEKISKIVALAGGASDARNQKETMVSIDKAVADAIEAHIHSLRESSHRAIGGWDATLSSILSTPSSGNDIPQMRIISDLWWEKNGIDNYMSIKTVKPNIDQTIVAKRDCLYLKVASPSCRVYFGLYYNPYGEQRAAYNHTPPMKIFDFHRDPVVLIGKEYWDTLGGEGCYEEILDIVKEAGKETMSSLNQYTNRC